MPGGLGRGCGRGFGGGMGLGFRGGSPPWPCTGLGREGLPRCSYYFRGEGLPPYQPPAGARAGYRPFTAPMSKGEELDYLKKQAEALKSRLDEIESRMHDLEARG